MSKLATAIDTCPSTRTSPDCPRISFPSACRWDYPTRGPKLWPFTYDYFSTEGPATIPQKIDSTPSAKLSPKLSVVVTLHRLEEKLGAKGFGLFFAELLAFQIRSYMFVHAVSSKVSGPTKSHLRLGVTGLGAGPL